MESNKMLPDIERALGLKFDHQRELSGKQFHYAPTRASDAALEIIEKRCLDWANDCTVFVGLEDDDSMHGVYAGPKISPLELIAPFGVGTHNDWETSDSVLEMMTEVFQKAPFVAYFADAAGYRIKFLHEVADEHAREFEQLIEEVCPDAIELHELGVFETIKQHRRLVLWWD
jgi:hypothetical protein